MQKLRQLYFNNTDLCSPVSKQIYYNPVSKQLYFRYTRIYFDASRSRCHILKRKCHHFDDLFANDCKGNYQRRHPLPPVTQSSSKWHFRFGERCKSAMLCKRTVITSFSPHAGMAFSLQQSVLLDLFTPKYFMRSQAFIFAGTALIGQAFIPLSGNPLQRGHIDGLV